MLNLMDFNKFYFKYGIRKLVDFLIPKIIDAGTVIFPYYTTLAHYRPLENDEPLNKSNYPTKKDPLLRFITNTELYNQLKYINPTFKEYKELRIPELKVIRELKKQFTDFPIITSHELERLLRNTPEKLKLDKLQLVFNLINRNYKYKDRPVDTFYKFYNSFKTVFEKILEVDNMYNSKNNLYYFLLVETPDILPPKDKLLSSIYDGLIPTVNDLKHYFFNYELLTMRELLRILDYSLAKEESVIKSILREKDPGDLLNRIILSLRNKDKIMFLSLGVLLSYSSSYDFLFNRVKIPDNKLMIYTFLLYHKILKFPSFTADEIDKNKHLDVLGKKIGLNDLEKKIESVERNLEQKLIKKVKENNPNTVKNLKGDKTSINPVKNALPTKPEKTIILSEDDLSDVDKIMNQTEKMISDNDLTELSEDIKITYSRYNKVGNYKEVMNYKPTLVEEVNNILEELLENDVIDKKRYKKLKEMFNNFLEKPSPFGDGKKIKDLLVIEDDEVNIEKDDVKLPKTKVLINNDEPTKTVDTMHEKYIQKVMKKDFIRTIVSLARAGLIPKKITTESKKTILEESTEWDVEVSDLGRRTFNIRFKTPDIYSNGLFRMSTHTYRMRMQITDYPIKKIDPKTVALSSAYGKAFVKKAPYTKNDRGYSIYRELNKLVNTGFIKNLVAGSLKLFDIVLPVDYTNIARYVKSYKTKTGYYFSFNFLFREELLEYLKLKNIDLNKIEQVTRDDKGNEHRKYVLLGSYKDKEPVLMDMNNIVYVYKNGRYIDVGDILELSGVDKTKIKNEYSLVTILNKLVPVAYLLAYYMGLENMLKNLDVKYEILEGKKNIKEPNAVVVKFKFNTLVIYPENALQRMIVEGFRDYEKHIKNLDISVLYNRNSFNALFNEVGLNLAVVTDIQVLENLFVDPVTEDVLKRDGLPTTFVGLLIKASEMLVTDYYIHPTDFEHGYRLRNFERIPQFLYQIIVDNIRKKKSEEFFGRSRLTIDRYQLWREINTDNTSILVDDLNPIVEMKQNEDVTFLGKGGRAKESMSKVTRMFHKSMLGVISEAAKDNGDVGISAYLTNSPLIKNLRGVKDRDIKFKDMKWSNIVSTSALIAPFIAYDDPKRVTYNNIMNSHIVPIKKPKVYPIRTGYESIIPFRTSKGFVGIAEGEGTVKDVRPNEIVVEYRDKTLGKKSYKFYNWTSKEEANTTYLHVLVPNVKKGDKVSEGDCLYYDKGYFEPDLFDPKKVIYRAGTVANVAFNEIQETWEDAGMISKKLADETTMDYVKVRDVIINASDNVYKVVKPGQEVKGTTPLFILTTGIEDFGDEIDEKTLELLTTYLSSSPKAKYEGVIIKIQVFYNCDKKDLSPTLRKLVNETKNFNYIKETGETYDSKVDSSYSVRGKPLEEGKVHIKFYIKINADMGTGDKGVFANQLKTTITTVYDYPIVNESGENIDALFSYKGVSARIVSSTDLMGTSAKILELIGKKAVELYKGK